MYFGRIATVVLGGALLAASPISLTGFGSNIQTSFFEVNQAYAGSERRREVRRTVRHIDRRHHRRTHLPNGCVRAWINGTRYWRCGRVFYRDIVENNTTVYIIVEL